jgi:RND family efflux transporter MFP subunit
MKENAMSQGEFDQIATAERVADARYSAALNGAREKIALIRVRTAELALARQQLSEAVIRSPLNGYVAQRDVAPGTFLAAGQPLATIVRVNPLRFRGSVPERHAQKLAVDQPVSLRIESVAEPRLTKIARISPTLDQQSRSLSFEAEIENTEEASVRSGLFAEAEVIVDAKAQAIVVPRSAVIEFAGAQKVWKVVDGMVSEQEVLCGSTRDDKREILTGLSAGDQILVNAMEGRIAKLVSRSNPEALAEDSSNEPSNDVTSQPNTPSKD